MDKTQTIESLRTKLEELEAFIDAQITIAEEIETDAENQTELLMIEFERRTAEIGEVLAPAIEIRDLIAGLITARDSIGQAIENLSPTDSVDETDYVPDDDDYNPDDNYDDD